MMQQMADCNILPLGILGEVWFDCIIQRKIPLFYLKENGCCDKLLRQRS